MADKPQKTGINKMDIEERREDLKLKVFSVHSGSYLLYISILALIGIIVCNGAGILHFTENTIIAIIGAIVFLVRRVSKFLYPLKN